MNYRRNLGVAAVTAAVVTTALVGTTLPDLMADRAENSLQQEGETAASSVVVTELPDVPSAKEISHAKESSDTTDSMISEINERLSQANQRALELEAALQMEQQEALEAQEAAEEAAREAEEATDTAETQAAEDYQDGETSPEDVLLAEDENTLADAATEDRLSERAEDEADTAQQEADEADQLAANAEELETAADDASRNSTQAAENTSSNFEELGESVRDLLEAAAELEGYEDLRTYYSLVLGNPDLIDEDGDVDTEALGWHIASLRDDAQTSSSDEDEDETAEDSAEDEEGEASSSAESEATEEDAEESPEEPSEEATEEPEEEETTEAAEVEEEDAPEPAEEEQARAGHSLSQYLPGTRALVGELAELSDESIEETFQRLIDDSDFTTDDGLLDHSSVNSEVNRLAPTPEPEEEEEEEQEDDAEQESESEGGSDEPSEDSQSSGPAHSLSQYQSGTRGLVEQIAELSDESATETFERLIDDSDFTTSEGHLNHSALQREVNRLSPSQESSSSNDSNSSDSGSSNNQNSGSSDNGQQTSAGGGGGSDAAQIAADWARSTVQRSGVFYQLGGNGPEAWDCSSLTQQAMAQAGVSIPRTSQAQFNGGQSVSLDSLQVGDLVFWGGNGSIHHVAIYIGDGQIAHARNPSSGLSVTSVHYAYESPNPTAKRYF